jgi:hypothetical protein
MDRWACMKSMHAWVRENACHWGISRKHCNALVRCTSFNRCKRGGMSSSLKCVMKSKHFHRRQGNDMIIQPARPCDNHYPSNPWFADSSFRVEFWADSSFRVQFWGFIQMKWGNMREVSSRSLMNASLLLLQAVSSLRKHFNTDV